MRSGRQAGANGTMLTDHDIYLFKEGTHGKLGCHLDARDGAGGAHFAVWAPNAQRVSVIGDWNGWSPDIHWLQVREDDSGVWEGFVPGVTHGQAYKYHIESRVDGYGADKADPLPCASRRRPIQ